MLKNCVRPGRRNSFCCPRQKTVDKSGPIC
nr:MAG TPA: hypothetical protein [Caudoviricetes sp.]